MRRLVRAVALLVAASGPALAGTYIPPPIMPVPGAWQGRAQGVIRVLDKLDAHIETLTLKAGETGRYKSLSVTLRSCMDRPDGMPRDSAANLDIVDQHGDTPPFSGWTFSAEPAIGVFESPIYGVQLVDCQGDLVAPMAPPLPAPVPPPASMVHDTPAPAQDTGDDTTPGGQTPDSADAAAEAGSIPDPSASPPPAQPAPAVGQPDPVYPDGAPPRP